MPDITIVKLKIRRGTDNQRRSIVLDQGELGYTIDTARVYVGNGVKTGGDIVGNLVYPPTLSPNTRINQTQAVVGDLIYDNSLLWQLTGTDPKISNSWTSISPKADNTFIEYGNNNLLTIKNNSITPAKLNSSIALNNGGLSFTSNGLSVDVDGTYVIRSGNKVTINNIDQTKIASSSFSRGIQGGSGTSITLNADSSLFGFTTNTLTLTALPNEVVSVESLSSTFIGTGLQRQGGGISTVVQNYDSGSFLLDTNTLRLKTITTAGTTAFENITFNSFGQVINTASAISTTLSGSNTGSMSAFNGNWNQTTFTNQTLLTAISSSPTNPSQTARLQLSSAGFMAINTRLGDRFAIPIFRF